MHVDAQTRRDLEILQARDGGTSIAGLMDHTKTEVGARRLRSRLSAPSKTTEDLTRAFESVSFLRDRNLRFTPRADLVRGAELYLESNFDTMAPRGALKKAVYTVSMSLRYRDAVTHAREGIQTVRALAAQIDRLVGQIETASPPDGLKTILDEIRVLSDELRLERLRDHSGLMRVLEMDRLLRHEGRDAHRRWLDLIGELDVLFSATELLSEGYTLPTIEEGPALHLSAEGAWHPFVAKPVANPIGLRGGETLIFLTGPNMAGKTTYLKAIGLCVYLAHCGFPVPAQSFRFSKLDGLFTSLSPEDNIRAGLSYFMAEVRRVREVAEFLNSGGSTLAIFDEVFRGTNVRDALEASRTVISGCARADRSAFLFSSHLVELAEDLVDVPKVRFFCFNGTLGDGEAVFDYTVKPGVSDQRFGLELLRQEGVPQLLEALGR